MDHEAWFEGTTAQSRDYQVRICDKSWAMIHGTWKERNVLLPAARSILIDSPTGSGKTVMALALARQAARSGMRIGWAAMRRNLLKQTEDIRARWGFDLDIKYMSMFAKNPPTEIDWLFVDEAQHDSTDSMSHIHAAIKPKVVIGMSATPFRGDRAKLSFERVIHDAGIGALIREGWLSEYDHFTIPSYTPEAVAALINQSPERWGKSVAFFLTLDECRRFASMVRVPNEVVWSGSDRERQLDDFDEGKLKVLSAMSILSEGFDCPDLKTAFLRPSTKGPTTQMGGRVLRKDAACGVKNIVQCQDTRYPFVRTAPARHSFVLVGSEFRSLHGSEKVDEVSRHYAEMALRVQVSIPDFIKKRLTKARVLTELMAPQEPGEPEGPRRRRRRQVRA